MSFSNPEGVERRYGGVHGYGHKGYQRRTFGVWMRTLAPPRTPLHYLAARLGWKLDAPAIPVDLRSAVLDARGPGIFDQLSTSSCTGQAETGATMTRLVLRGTPAPARLSPLDAYRKGRRIDLPLLADGRAQPLVDDGAIPEQVTRACAEFGVCSYDALPNDPARVNEEPKLGDAEQAMKWAVRGIYGLGGSDVELGVQTALAQRFPVKLGALVDRAFEAWRGGDPAAPPDPARILGGHAMYVVGWDNWTGGTEYILTNSWGTSYGEGGFVRVSGLWLRQASDFEVADVQDLQEAA